MSTMKGSLGHTAKGDDDSSMSEVSSDHEYELQEIRPEVFNSKSSLSKRKRIKCCTCDCFWEWSVIVGVFAVFYVLCGLFAWALIMALIADTNTTLTAFGVIWVVFVIVLFTLIYIISERIKNKREAHQREVDEEEKRKRDENIARNRG